VCGRFNVESDPLSRLLMELVGLPHPGPDNHNAAPTEMLTVLRHTQQGQPELVPMRWWLTPYWAKEPGTKYSMFNAKSETIDKSPAFREPFRKRRALVPVSGFYEWARGPAPGQKHPYYLRAEKQPGLLLAGVWDHWRSATAEGEAELLSFAILTTAASNRLEFVHHRQPVIVSPADAGRWLDAAAPADELRALLEPRVPVPLEVLPVSNWVNNARNKDRRCTEPVAATVHVPADA
jgi:putative SOS response-associated peptidase YedK